jgi:hypothetical protein
MGSISDHPGEFVSDLSGDEQTLFERLSQQPPLPPWKAFPDLDRYSMGWRMGDGEDHLYLLYIFFKYSTPEMRAEYEALHPEPEEWNGWYAEIREDEGLTGRRLTQRRCIRSSVALGRNGRCRS